MRESGGNGSTEFIQKEIKKIEPAVITNMARDPKEKKIGNVIQNVAENYLMLHLHNLGGVVYDDKIPMMVSGMVPLTRLGLSSEAFVNAYEIAARLIRLN